MSSLAGLWSLLPREAWQALLASGTVRRFEKDEVLMRQGEPGSRDTAVTRDKADKLQPLLADPITSRLWWLEDRPDKLERLVDQKMDGVFAKIAVLFGESASRPAADPIAELMSVEWYPRQLVRIWCHSRAASGHRRGQPAAMISLMPEQTRWDKAAGQDDHPGRSRSGHQSLDHPCSTVHSYMPRIDAPTMRCPGDRRARGSARAHLRTSAEVSSRVQT
jgi:hypothetical protein